MPNYDGIAIKQREGNQGLLFFAFATTADQILSWSAIQRTAEQFGGAQRLRNEAHIRTIKAYIEASEHNIIPTCVTLALLPDRYEVAYDEATLAENGFCQAVLTVQPEAEDGNKPALIIDGQHRILAFDSLENENPRLLACAVLGADALEQALHFVIINNKTKRVPSDLVKAIMAELSPEQRDELKHRLTRVGITLGNFASALQVLDADATSPFFQLIDWDINREGFRRIKPAAIESSLRAIMSDLNVQLDKDVDDSLQILAAMWRGVRNSWNLVDVEWNAKNDETSLHSKLVDKAGLVSVTEFLIERINLKIEEGFNATDLEAVEEYCQEVMNSIPSRFWVMEWNQKQLDTSVGRGLIRQSLSAIRTAAANNADDPLQDATLVSMND